MTGVGAEGEGGCGVGREVPYCYRVGFLGFGIYGFGDSERVRCGEGFRGGMVGG